MTFGPLYAESYDVFYAGKDYELECDLVEELFARYRSGVRSVLDLGCGTGGHALPLARRGYAVVGVDRSPEMLTRARAKTGAAVELVEGDVRTVELDRRFDAALLLFAVLGYQTTDEDVLATLGTARRHLRDGGLLLFDVWYGPAVLHEGPSRRVARFPAKGGQIVREATPELDADGHTCTVRYRVERLSAGRVVEEREEAHRVRFFFPDELRLLLERTGFELLQLGAFPDVDRQPDASTWNVLGVAQASA
jgi:SAM-dependent methyltransferase